jgi:hypothetical protein
MNLIQNLPIKDGKLFLTMDQINELHNSIKMSFSDFLNLRLVTESDVVCGEVKGIPIYLES